MNARAFIRNSAIGLAVLAFAGAGIGTISAKAEVPPTAPQHKNQASYEARLGKQVSNQLLALPWINLFDNVEYRINGSRVTLMGQVVDPVTGSVAESSVKSIKGVTQVVNKIQVLPLSPFDNQIRWAEYRSIFSEPSLSRYLLEPVPSIHIVVDNGHVTLDGYVDSQMDRELAGIRARTVPGVFSVANHLQVA